MALLNDDDEEVEEGEEKELDLTPFFRIHAELLMLFHQHWLKENYTVMRTSVHHLCPFHTALNLRTDHSV